VVQRPFHQEGSPKGYGLVRKNFVLTATEGVIMEEQLQKALNNVSFSVNAEKQTMDLTVIPHGETTPISFHLNYKIVENGEKTEFFVTKIASDRLWVDEIVKMWLEKSNFNYKIPQNIAGIVKMFLK
jgi:hypothetical protein